MGLTARITRILPERHHFDIIPLSSNVAQAFANLDMKVLATPSTDGTQSATFTNETGPRGPAG